MRKLIAIVLIAMMMFTGAALAESPLGGWTLSESIELTDEVKAVFDKGMEGLLGVDYVPLAYLGSQVVAGRNHCFLCRATVVYPGAQSVLALVYLYEDLSGGVSVTDIVPFDIGEMPFEDAEAEEFSTEPSMP